MKNYFDKVSAKEAKQEEKKQQILLQEFNPQDTQFVSAIENLGWHKSYEESLRKINIAKEKEFAKQELGEIFTLEEIIKHSNEVGYGVCKYNHYTGPINNELISLIEQIAKENMFPISSMSSLEHLYIVAPLQYIAVEKQEIVNRNPIVKTLDFPITMAYKISEDKKYDKSYYRLYHANSDKKLSLSSRLYLSYCKLFCQTDMSFVVNWAFLIFCIISLFINKEHSFSFLMLVSTTTLFVTLLSFVALPYKEEGHLQNDNAITALGKYKSYLQLLIDNSIFRIAIFIITLISILIFK